MTAEEAALAIIGRATDNDKKTIKGNLNKLIKEGMA